MDGNDFFKLESYLDSDPVDTTKVQPIDYKCALLIYPNEKQIEEMKKEYGEDFFTIADDGNYYQGTAIGLLDSLKIKTISANKPFIRFIGTNKTWTLNLTRKGLPAWNLIFFARNKEPEIIGTAGLTTEKVNEFFQRAE